jgi:hypothetical protein
MSLRKEGTADVGGGLSAWLLHHAARAAPEALSERLEEEWLADLATRESGWSRLHRGWQAGQILLPVADPVQAQELALT